MIHSSSADLHPETGGRFVFERRSGDPPRYRVLVALPARQRFDCDLDWDPSGALRLDPEPTDPWIAAELHKLARVLHRDPKARLVRWRGR